MAAANLTDAQRASLVAMGLLPGGGEAAPPAQPQAFSFRPGGAPPPPAGAPFGANPFAAFGGGAPRR
jgi:hypothetical protein